MANKFLFFEMPVIYDFLMILYFDLYTFGRPCGSGIGNTVVQTRQTLPIMQMKQVIQLLEVICKTYWVSSRGNLLTVVVTVSFEKHCFKSFHRESRTSDKHVLDKF